MIDSLEGCSVDGCGWKAWLMGGFSSSFIISLALCLSRSWFLSFHLTCVCLCFTPGFSIDPPRFFRFYLFWFFFFFFVLSALSSRPFLDLSLYPSLRALLEPTVRSIFVSFLVFFLLLSHSSSRPKFVHSGIETQPNPTQLTIPFQPPF